MISTFLGGMLMNSFTQIARYKQTYLDKAIKELRQVQTDPSLCSGHALGMTNELQSFTEKSVKPKPKIYLT